MCEECGCEEKDKKHTHQLEDHDCKEHDHENMIIIEKSVNEENNAIAHETWHELQKKGIFCVNLLGAPGSGKTTFIEGISKYISPAEIAVIQGDLESDIDKERLFKSGIDAYQINTHSGCHLNAKMIFDALKEMDLSKKKYLIIENVGNLVCPAGVKIGQHMNMVVSSTTEGSDKPKKYPIIFMDAKLIVISKSDLAEAVEFDEEQYIQDVTHINGKAKILKTTKKKPESFYDAAHFLEHEQKHLTGHSHDHGYGENHKH